MGSLCSLPSAPLRMKQEEQCESIEERGRVNLLRQLSYDIYKIQGVKDPSDDFEKNWRSQGPSKRYYGVSQSTINQVRPKLPQGSNLSSFRSVPSARMASFSDWTRTHKTSSTELALEQLRTETLEQLRVEISSPSSRASASSSESSDFESNLSDQPPSVDLALDRTLEEQLESTER